MTRATDDDRRPVESPAALGLRSAIEIWPAGFRVARMTAGPLVLFIAMTMLFAGALSQYGGGPVLLGFLWLAGVYAAAIVFVAAYRCAATAGAEAGMAALGGSGALHRAALRGALIAAAGALLGFGALRLAVGPPVYEPVQGAAWIIDLYLAGQALTASAGPVVAAAAFGVAMTAAGVVFGDGAGRAAARGMATTPSWPLRTAPRRAAAALLGVAPLAVLAMWLELARPSAQEAGGYWTLAHATGELATFAAAGLALVMAGVALADGAEARPAQPPRRGRGLFD